MSGSLLISRAVRDQAVSDELAAVVHRSRQSTDSGTAASAAGVPLLFGLASAGAQQGGATATFLCRLFQHDQQVSWMHTRYA